MWFFLTCFRFMAESKRLSSSESICDSLSNCMQLWMQDCMQKYMKIKDFFSVFSEFIICMLL